MKFQSIINILLMALGSILLFFLIRNEKSQEKIQITKDTVFIETYREPISLKRAKAKVKKSNDSIIATNPFTAIIDTIIKKDTLRINYFFPENEMDLSIKSAKDTLKKEISVEKSENKSSFLSDITPFLIGLAIGLLSLLFK